MLSSIPVDVGVTQQGVGELLFSEVVYCRRGDAVRDEWFIRGWGGVARRGEAGRPSGIVEPRRAERRGVDERSGAFGGGARAVDTANPLRAAVR